MPWTPKQFRARHAKHLTAEQASHAAKIANAILASGADEGTAIATGIARAKSAARRGHFNDRFRGISTQQKGPGNG